MIPEGMRDVLPPEAAELRAIEHDRAGSLQRLRLRRGAPAGARVPRDHGACRRRPAGVGLPSLRRARQGARAAHRPDHRRRPPGRRPSARAPLPLRLAYAGPVYRTETSRAGARARSRSSAPSCSARARPPPTPRPSCSSATRSPRPGCAATAWRSAAWRSTASWSPPWASRPTTADDVFDALADRDYALLETIVSRRGVDDEGRKTLQRALDLSPGKGALAAARKLASSEGMEEVVERLVAVQELADDAGYGELVGFDFGLMPEHRLLHRHRDRGLRPRRRLSGRQRRPLRSPADRLRAGPCRPSAS